MKIKWATIIILLLIITGCKQPSLTKEEILTRTVEEMSGVENYSFEIYSDHIDGMGNETISEVQGTTQVKPFRASINKHSELLGQPIDTKAYYIEDMVYYEDITAPNYLFEREVSSQPDHLLNGLKALNSRIEQLEFSEEGNYYKYEYSIEQEEDKEFFSSLYPYFLHIDPLEKSINEMYLENSDVVDFQVVIKLDKQTLLVKELRIGYVWNYDVSNSGDPNPMSETIEMSFSDYNELKDIPIPDEDIEKAVTFNEYLEMSESDGQTSKSDHVPETINENHGNSSANLMNGGRLTTDDEWVYYSLSDKGLFKQKRDGSERRQLSEHEVFQLNVIDDWLFYIDKDEENQAFKMKTDGSERIQITDTYTENLMVVDDWIYYIPLTYSPNGEKSVYRIKTDLSNQEKLLDHAFQFTVGQGYLFYQTDYPDYLHHIDLENLEKKPVMYTYLNTKNISISDGWIYYEDVEDGDRLYRISLDTHDTYQLTENASQGFNVKGNLIFYRNLDDDRNLYRYNVVTEENVKLDDGEVHDMHIINDYLYYGKTGTNKDMEWYRIPVSGKGIEKISFSMYGDRST